MFLNSVDNKPFFTRPDNTVVRDLTDTMFNFTNRNKVALSVYRIPRDYVMRPDLISKAVYNNSLYAEIILKYNGISNPFTINEGDYILIPNLESAQANTKKETGSSIDGAQAIRNSYKYIDPTKIPKKGQELQQFDEREIAPLLPPNIAQEGTTQITYRNGRVYFGESVATCLKSGSSTSEFLTNVIKSKNQV